MMEWSILCRIRRKPSHTMSSAQTCSTHRPQITEPFGLDLLPRPHRRPSPLPATGSHPDPLTINVRHSGSRSWCSSVAVPVVASYASLTWFERYGHDCIDGASSVQAAKVR